MQRAHDPAQPVDLLLTDVVMPEMLGHEIAARIGAVRPGVPALFMSGYAQPILDSHGVPSPQYDILEKPFTEVALLTRVRQVMTATRSASAADPAPASAADPAPPAPRDAGESRVSPAPARDRDPRQ